MDITSAWTPEERLEVAKVLCRASYEDKEHERLTSLSWRRMRMMIRLVHTVLNEPAQAIETNRNEIVMEYLRCRREQNLNNFLQSDTQVN